MFECLQVRFFSLRYSLPTCFSGEPVYSHGFKYHLGVQGSQIFGSILTSVLNIRKYLSRLTQHFHLVCLLGFSNLIWSIKNSYLGLGLVFSKRKKKSILFQSFHISVNGTIIYPVVVQAKNMEIILKSSFPLPVHIESTSKSSCQVMYWIWLHLIIFSVTNLHQIVTVYSAHLKVPESGVPCDTVG